MTQISVNDETTWQSSTNKTEKRKRKYSVKTGLVIFCLAAGMAACDETVSTVPATTDSAETTLEQNSPDLTTEVSISTTNNEGGSETSVETESETETTNGPSTSQASSTTKTTKTTKAPTTSTTKSNQTTNQGQSATPGTIPGTGQSKLVYSNDFSKASDKHRLDHFVHYRDPFVVNHRSGSSDHASMGGVNCSAPEQTRPQTRDKPEDHIYLCHPMGNADLGHMMAYAMDSSGYGFVGGMPDQVFEGVKEVSVDVNTTSAGTRNFVEIKVLPANETYVNALPCIPDLPCNDGWDYDDIGGVGAATESQEGTGLVIATPSKPDGYKFNYYDSFSNSQGTNYRPCVGSGFCFHAWTHEDNTGIRARFQHVFKDNGDGTLSFGINEGEETKWVTAPGAFPEGPVRVVIAFHNYTGTKDRNGPGYGGNVSPSTGGFTWHWDNLNVYAASSTPSSQFFNGNNPDRVVTPDNCVSFAQGQRNQPHGTDIKPEFKCV